MSSITYTTKNYRTYALSTEEGIFISASAFNEHEQPMSAFVKRNSDGQISIEVQNESLSSAHEDWKKNNSKQSEFIDKYVKVFQVAFTLMLAGISFIRVPAITVSVSVFWVISLFTSGLYNISYYCAALVYGKLKVPAISRYHGAEHMAFHAEIKYNRVPTVDEIANESIYEFACTTTESLLLPTFVSVVRTIIVTIISCFGFYILNYLTVSWQRDWKYNLIILFVVVSMTLVAKFLKKLPDIVKKCFENEKFLKLFQWSVVSKPGKDEIEVAQQAIKMLYFMNEKINNDPDGYAFEDVSFDILHKKAVYTFCNGQTGIGTLIDYINNVFTIINAEIVEDENDVSDIKTHDGSEIISSK